ncbi:unnamed protein product, partial [Meganyctiphanes norvegica]
TSMKSIMWNLHQHTLVCQHHNMLLDLFTSQPRVVAMISQWMGTTMPSMMMPLGIRETTVWKTFLSGWVPVMAPLRSGSTLPVTHPGCWMLHSKPPQLSTSPPQCSQLLRHLTFILLLHFLLMHIQHYHLFQKIRC